MYKKIRDGRLKLEGISDEAANKQVGEGGWTRKQLLGHLIDSASNNRYQIVKALLESGYTGPAYDQEGWVRLHNYTELPWGELVELWWSENRLLELVVCRIPEDKWGWTCAVGNAVDATIRDRVDDYLKHLEHHLGQM